jgi:hypothetical protein
MERANDDRAQYVLSHAARLAASKELNCVADHHSEADCDEKEL